MAARHRQFGVQQGHATFRGGGGWRFITHQGVGLALHEPKVLHDRVPPSPSDATVEERGGGGRESRGREEGIWGARGLAGMGNN